MKHIYTFTGKAIFDDGVNNLSDAFGFTEDDIEFLHKLTKIKVRKKDIFPELIARGQLNILLYLAVRGFDNIINETIKEAVSMDTMSKAVDSIILKTDKGKKDE